MNEYRFLWFFFMISSFSNCRVTQLLDCYEDSARRKRRWYPVDEAFKLLSTCKPQHSCYLASLATSKQLAGAAAAAATAATSPPQAAINNTCCGPAVAATSNPEEADRENG